MKQRITKKLGQSVALLLMLVLLGTSVIPATATTAESVLREEYDPVTGVSSAGYAPDGHYEIGTPEELAALRLPAGKVSSALTMLAIKGYVKKLPGNRVRRN